MLSFKRTSVTAGYLLGGAFQTVLLCFLRYVKLGDFNAWCVCAQRCPLSCFLVFNTVLGVVLQRH